MIGPMWPLRMYVTSEQFSITPSNKVNGNEEQPTGNKHI